MKNLRGNPFLLKGKMTRQISNNFTIIKLITIILVYVSRLKKKISLIFLFSHTHKLSFSKAAILFHCAASLSFSYATPYFFFFSLCSTLIPNKPYLYIPCRHTILVAHKLLLKHKLDHEVSYF